MVEEKIEGGLLLLLGNLGVLAMVEGRLSLRSRGGGISLPVYPVSFSYRSLHFYGFASPVTQTLKVL